LDLIKSPNQSLFRIFIREHPDIVNFKSEEHKLATLLFPAIGWGKSLSAKALIEAGADVNIRDSESYDVLFLAVREKNVDVVKLLLDHGANAGNVYEDEFTLLHTATIIGHNQIVKLLLSAGVSVNAQDKHGFSALHYACRDGNLNIVKLLLKTPGIDLGSLTEEYRCTPLHLASGKNNGAAGREIVALLLASGADYAVPNAYLSTPFFIACEVGSADILQMFLDRGGARLVNDQHECLYTPLLVACENKHKDVIKLLLANGADMTIVNDKCANCLHMVCEDNDRELLELLLCRGGSDPAIVNSRGKRGLTPLMGAAVFGHTEIVRVLLLNNADPTLRSDEGLDAEGYAARTSHHEIATLLASFSMGRLSVS